MAMTFEDIQTLNRDTVAIHGKFALGGSGSVSSQVGTGFTAAVVAATDGTWTITFSENHGDFLGAVATMETGVGSDRFIQTGGYTSATKILKLFCFDVSAGALADPALGDDIHFVAFFAKT